MANTGNIAVAPPCEPYVVRGKDAASIPADGDGGGASLLDLPDAALIDVLSHLRDPLPLACTCRHLAELLRSPSLHTAWLARFGDAVQPWRPAAGRLLTFRPLRGAPAQDLAAALLQQTEAAGQQPELVASARAALRQGQGPLRVLEILCPHAHALLLPYLALGGHHGLVQQAAQSLQWDDGGGDGGGGGGSRRTAAFGSRHVGCGDSSCGCDSGGVSRPWRWPLVFQNHPQLGSMDVLLFALHGALRSSCPLSVQALLDAVTKGPPGEDGNCQAHAAVSAGLHGSAVGAASGAVIGGAAGAAHAPGPQQQLWSEGAEGAAAGRRAAAQLLRGMEEVAAYHGCGPAILEALVTAVSAPDAAAAAAAPVSASAPPMAAALEPAGPGQEGQGALAGVALPAPLPPPLRSSSSYLLPAAAASGSLPTLEAALDLLDESSVLRQLPQALCLAGRGGHVDAVQALLRHPCMSSRPMEIAAHDAATRGWPAAALRPVASAVLARYREEATRLLAQPMEEAVALGRREVVDVLWEVLVQGRPEPERYTGLIVRLAAAGDHDRAQWIADAAPPVMVKVSTAPATAAAERGHNRLALLMAQRAGCPLPGGRAAAARGRLTAAVAAGDVPAVERALSEITLGPGPLRRELICGAASRGDVDMLLFLLEALGPWMGEEVDCLASLVEGGHWRLAAELHSRMGEQLRRRVLSACCKLCGAWLTPHAGLMVWMLGVTSNPAALDLTVAGYARTWQGSSSSQYLGGVVAPAPGIAMAISPAVDVWTKVLSNLVEGPGQIPASACQHGAPPPAHRVQPAGAPSQSPVAAAERRGGHARDAGRRDPQAGQRGRRNTRSRGSSGGGGSGGGGGGPSPSGAGPSGSRRQDVGAQGGSSVGRVSEGMLAPGAVRLTRRMLEVVLETGSCDLLYQLMVLVDVYVGQVQVV